MKIRATALAQQIFKAPVHFCYPTEQLDTDGNTVYGKASFIGRFRTTTQDEGLANLANIEAAQGQGTAAVVIEMRKQAEQILIGFEPMPGKEFPLADDNDVPLASTPESIKEILKIGEVREAVNKAYQSARHPSVIDENLKK